MANRKHKKKVSKTYVYRERKESIRRADSWRSLFENLVKDTDRAILAAKKSLEELRQELKIVKME
jgi:hypothetical protein